MNYLSMKNCYASVKTVTESISSCPSIPVLSEMSLPKLPESGWKYCTRYNIKLDISVFISHASAYFFYQSSPFL